MSYMTDRKRAEGLGSAKSGTEHYWGMIQSSVGLLILVPLFVFTFGPILGSSYEEVIAYYSRPFPAIVAALTIVVSWLHFKNGAQTAIEDYSRGTTRKLLIIAVNCIAYAAAAAGLFALVALAF
ncbi:succinate dehydrogenase / fumarate reductase membrane anchor subunit [Palleronia aestuarii]|uniref:Succinate dehydrogenase / fumarate reductase membrane anchor subunit n=1 Tax=Palleronia aestuarii TaxID=568105 RepID=A0A2W7Q9H2_9RHOB|nr:succinate dehydrogenase, hydrophobic membrane anchor protein [Palleronia aestuarii]PZX18359.1 succinate dehydrogenase / fumarate reductase membrane anchor subunit [Palleronia aestuarii]